MQYSSSPSTIRSVSPTLFAGALVGVLCHLFLFYSGIAMIFYAPDEGETRLIGPATALFSSALVSPLLLVPLLLVLTTVLLPYAPRTGRFLCISGSLGLGAFLGPFILFLYPIRSFPLLVLILLVLFIVCTMLYTPHVLRPTIAMLLSSITVFLVFVLAPSIMRWYFSLSLPLTLLVSFLMLGHGLWQVSASIISMRVPQALHRAIGASGVVSGAAWFLYIGCDIVSTITSEIQVYSGFELIQRIKFDSAYAYLLIYPIWLLGISFWLYERQKSAREHITYSSA